MESPRNNVLLAVSGSIAAYKACEIARELIHRNIDVTVTMTPNGTQFVTPLTFETLTSSKCLVDTFDRNFQYDVSHVSAAKKADVCVVAPATANIIGKIASGIADDMTTTTIMACTCPRIVAPAMNTAMYDNPATQENLDKLRRYGWRVVEPASGLLACGDTGRGKLADVGDIVAAIMEELEKVRANGVSGTPTAGGAADAAVANTGETGRQSTSGATRAQDLNGRNVLVTAGPTREAIDPVRFITNHSSGKMGYAAAIAARDRGANVTLISGPTNLPVPEGISFVPVVSAEDMANAVAAGFGDTDILIMAAAVADYRPKETASSKIKKSGDLELDLVRTTDILASVKDIKKPGQFVLGFAMETENLIENARGKLISKGLDMIAANSISEEGAGFGVETNRITLISADGQEDLPLISKRDASDIILDRIVSKIRIS